MEDFQYASISEMKGLKLTQPSKVDKPPLPLPQVQQQPADIPPPLPPPNPGPKNQRSPLLAVNSNSVSEENVSSSNSLRPASSASHDASHDSNLHTSNSSPMLTSLVVDRGEKSPARAMEEGVDGRQTPLYATINKNKRSESSSSTPPPLPPPLLSSDVPVTTSPQNGETESEFDGLVFVPLLEMEVENNKPRRPVPLPRAHVYETVPDDIKKLEQTFSLPPKPSSNSTFASSILRKSIKRKKTDKERSKTEERKSLGLISLSDLEPLPSGGDSMRLSEFVHRFSHYLPLCVRVDEGYCGTEERFVISSGDIYNFHFVKNEKMFSIRDSRGMNFSIPLNSAVEFGVLYNPSNDLKVALQGYTFKTVSELAASKHTPLIVCSTKSHLTGESKSSTQSDELLIVKKISRTTVMRKPVLKAFSLMTGEDKVLQEDCEGHFSTHPDIIKIYLPEVLEHFHGSLPLEAMLFTKSENSEDLPYHLTSDMVMLTHTTIESSIIASTCWEYDRDEELSEEDRALVAIPTDLDIEVTFLGKESEAEQLCEETKSYFEKFGDLKITDMKNSGGMQRGEGLTLAQKKLYKAVREGYESKGTEIKMPYRISGVFDGEVSPQIKTYDEAHIYHTLLPDLTEGEGGGGGGEEGRSLGPGSNYGHREHRIDTSPDHTSPDHTLNSSNRPPTNSHTHYPPPTHAPPPAPPLSLDNPEDLSAMYSAIDHLFESTIGKDAGSGNYYSSTPEESISNKNTGDTATTQSADTNAAPQQPPKPFPRTKSQTELKPETRSQSFIEVVKTGSQNGDTCVPELRRRATSNEVMMGEEERIEKLTSDYAKLEIEVRKLKKELRNTREISAGYEVVERRYTNPPFRNKQRPTSMAKAYSIEDQESNKEYLRNLDHIEIITLLESMNLSQYKEQFMREQVDGEILSECNETILEKELNVSSAIHRTRLLKVITGRHSALNLMEGNSLYSTLEEYK